MGAQGFAVVVHTSWGSFSMNNVTRLDNIISPSLLSPIHPISRYGRTAYLVGQVWSMVCGAKGVYGRQKKKNTGCAESLKKCLRFSEVCDNII